MTTTDDSKNVAPAAPSSQAAHQLASRQQTPSQSYFSASPSPPPSTPPPPPPSSQKTPFVSRVMTSTSSRRSRVKSGFLQLETQDTARKNGQPIPPLDTSVLKMKDFSQESSDENPVERFCVWDLVEDPNVVHARTTMAALEQEEDVNAKSGSWTTLL